MDKDDAQHLEEYTTYLKALKIRVSTLEALIRGIVEKESELVNETPKEFFKADYNFDKSRNRVEND